MAQDARWLRFGPFELDLETGDLLGPDGPVALQPLPARVLVFLASHPGMLVPREAIQREIWGDATFAADQALNTCIRLVRIALADDASDPEFVSTVPRRGYRFTTEVRPGEGPVGPRDGGMPDAEMPDAATREPHPVRAWGRVAIAVAAVLFVAAIGISQLAGSRGGVAADDALRTAAMLPDDLRLEYLKGREHLQSTDSAAWRRAARAFDVVREDRPEFLPATAGAAHAALRLGEFERAAGLAAWAIAADSASGEAHMVLGSTLLRRGEWAAARSSLERARALSPGIVSSYTGLAVLAALDGMSDSALALAEASVDIDPISSITLGDAGYVALWAGRADRALDWCRHAGELRPDWTVPRYCMLDAYHALGREGAERDEAAKIMEMLGAPAERIRDVRAARAADGLRAYRAWQRRRIDPTESEPPHLAAYLAFLHMQDGAVADARRLMNVASDEDPVQARLTLLDPVFAPFRGD